MVSQFVFPGFLQNPHAFLRFLNFRLFQLHGFGSPVLRVRDPAHAKVANRMTHPSLPLARQLRLLETQAVVKPALLVVWLGFIQPRKVSGLVYF